MKSGLKEKVVSWFTFGTLALIVLGGLKMMYPEYRRSEEYRNANRQLQEKIEAKKREIARLRENQRRFRMDADFVEMIARQNHRVSPGELVFVFDKE